MDKSFVNESFATESLELVPFSILGENQSSPSFEQRKVKILDAGTGTARIPILEQN